MPEISCGWCSKKKKVRSADIKRGWGKYCSKSCKAKDQAKKKGGKSNHRKVSSKKRFDILTEAWAEGRISDEYYYFTVREEYPEFEHLVDGWESYIN